MTGFSRHVLATSLIFVFSIASFCQSTATADALKAINKRDDLWNSSFHLEADFVAQLTKPETGHLTWNWSTKDSWYREISLGKYHEIRVRKGDQLFIARNAVFTPLPVLEIDQLFAKPSVRFDKWEVKKARRADAQNCLELEFIPGGHWKREICISSDKNDVLSDESRDNAEVIRKEFGDYQPFLAYRYPHELKLIQNGGPVLRIVVTLLEEQTYTSGFTPPPNATVWRTCDDIIPPKAVKMPDPTYPPAELEKHVGGTSVVSLTVLPDGSVSDVHLIGSSNADMDEATQQILKKWEFKPAMCGDEPVASDIQVRVNFRTR